MSDASNAATPAELRDAFPKLSEGALAEAWRASAGNLESAVQALSVADAERMCAKAKEGRDNHQEDLAVESRAGKRREVVEIDSSDEADSGPEDAAAGDAASRPSNGLGSGAGTPKDAGASSSCAPAPAPFTIDDALASVLSIVPDVLPAHARSLLEKHASKEHEAIGIVVDLIFDDVSYPRAPDSSPSKKRKRANDDGADAGLPAKARALEFDYGKVEGRARPTSANYAGNTLTQLQSDYPLVPLAFIRATLKQQGDFYAPTHAALAETAALVAKPYKDKKVPFRAKGKLPADPEFKAELEWVKSLEMSKIAENDAEIAEQLDEEENGGIECGCCFGEYAFDKMVQCEEGHLFCSACARRAAEEQIGHRKTELKCLSSDGCMSRFPMSEVKRFLPVKTWNLLHRIIQEREIETAGIEGLESCPFCPFSVIIDNADEKLFRCENEECAAVTCRQCKKANHLPRSCQEVEDNKKLDARHTVEEAMTKALIRPCPQCKQPFMKSDGCNKMTCPNCRTISCYVCRKAITDGYNHFDQNPAAYDQPRNTRKCPLWEDANQRHDREVTEAARVAQEAARQGNADLNEDDVQVELSNSSSSNKRRRKQPEPKLKPRTRQPVQPSTLRRCTFNRRGRRCSVSSSAMLRRIARGWLLTRLSSTGSRRR